VGVVATGILAAVAAIAALLVRRLDSPEVSSQGVAAAEASSGARSGPLATLYDCSCAHGHVRDGGLDELADPGAMGLAAVAVIIVGEAYLTSGRWARREVVGVGNGARAGLTWTLATVLPLAPSGDPSTRVLDGWEWRWPASALA